MSNRIEVPAQTVRDRDELISSLERTLPVFEQIDGTALKQEAPDVRAELESLKADKKDNPKGGLNDLGYYHGFGPIR